MEMWQSLAELSSRPPERGKVAESEVAESTALQQKQSLTWVHPSWVELLLWPQTRSLYGSGEEAAEMTQVGVSASSQQSVTDFGVAIGLVSS